MSVLNWSPASADQLGQAALLPSTALFRQSQKLNNTVLYLKIFSRRSRMF